MAYDFDTPTERRGTDSLKFDRAEARGRSSDLLSFWVADMDFPTAPEVVQAIQDRAAHGVFGYTEPGPTYLEALDSWCSRRYGWHVPAEQVTVTPGVVFALAAAVRAFTDPGDAVLIQRPVYYPFTDVIEANGRTVANVPLVFDGSAYAIDFEMFEQTARESGAKLFLLCNPHNPVGRAWSAAELLRLSEICAACGIVVVSDEIHMDFARPGIVHTPFAALGQELARHSIACTSASKTFNLAGLQTANIVIPDRDLRRSFRDAVAQSGYSQANTLGLVATHAAYENGEPWLDELKGYLEGNWDLLARTLAERAPELRLVEAESTYLAWIDCRSLGLGPRELKRFVEDEAGLWLDCGHIFGPEGAGFIRINIATQRAYLSRALEQLCDAASRRRTL